MTRPASCQARQVERCPKSTPCGPSLYSSQHTFIECLLCIGPWASREVGRGTRQMTKTWTWSRGHVRGMILPGHVSFIRSFNRSLQRASSCVTLPGLYPSSATDGLCGLEQVTSSPGPQCRHLYNGGIRSSTSWGGPEGAMSAYVSGP